MKTWLFVGCILLYIWWTTSPPWNAEVSKWLADHGLTAHEQLFKRHGVQSLLDLADGRSLPEVAGADGLRLAAACQTLRHQLVFQFWLAQTGHGDRADRLSELQVQSLEELVSRSDVVLRQLPEMARAVTKLPSHPDALDAFSRQLFDEMKQPAGRSDRSAAQDGAVRQDAHNSAWVTVWRLCVALCAALLADLVYRLWRDVPARRSLAAPLRRLMQLAVRCHVQLHWADRRRVGGVVTLTVKAERLDGRPYDLSGAELQVHVLVRGSPVSAALERRQAEASCTFPVRAAGTYLIAVTLDGRHVADSPYTRQFLADLPDAGVSCLLSHSSTVVMTQGQPCPLALELRDAYNNGCEPADWPEIQHRLAVSVAELDSGRVVVPYERLDLEGHRVQLSLVLSREGCFQADITYDGQTVKNGRFYLVVLSAYNMSAVKKHVETRTVSFAARLTSVSGQPLNKPRHVWCYVSPKQLTVRETVFFFMQRKLFTFRVCPSTRLTPSNERNAAGLPSLTVCDGCQPALELSVKDRDTLAATFACFLRRNVGGSETFSDKRRHLFRQLERSAAGRSRRVLPLTVRRGALLESSLAALRSVSAADWYRPFEVRFGDEDALDYGGVRREWFELVCGALFEPRGLLFTPLDGGSDGGQALVHPNPRRPAHLRTRVYEFAGRLVGKCLLESAQGGAARQLVRASFTRSFLAQLIGLRVSYKHFEQDDRELYRTKISLIETCSADELAAFDLTFVDEEFDERGRLVQTVELRSGGARTAVTTQNRLEYLQALAQYRLSTRCKTEVDAFLRGLNDLVPDHLLSIFDENELELLMCGSSEFSVAELRRHHTVTDHSAGFEKVLGWFWTALENFSAEEMSRLLQFTTGCARLPAGGFAELTPKFQISSYHEFGALPVAHTCFNQLCLADHDGYSEFERTLLLAIREGNVGFGLL